MPVTVKKVMAELPAERRASVETRAAELIAAEHARRNRIKRTGPRYHVFRDAAGEWRWRLVASNGAVIANSGEGYSSKSGCLNAIGRVKAAADADVAIDA